MSDLHPATSSVAGYIGTGNEWYSYHAAGLNSTSNLSRPDWSEVWSVPKWTDPKWSDNFPENVGPLVNQGFFEAKGLDEPQNDAQDDLSHERLLPAPAPVLHSLKRPSRDDWESILKEIITKLYHDQKKKIEECVQILRHDYSYLVT